jgi:hypothetical protein
MRVKLVGLTGHAGVGKDTFAESFHYYGFRQYSFADPVKKAAAIAFGISQDYFRIRELKEEAHPYWNLSPRQMAQLVGTEMFRSVISDDFWIRRLELQLMHDFDSHSDVCAIVSDVRFQNEADWIVNKMNGILVEITRPDHVGAVGVAGHASEAGIDSTNYLKGVNYFHIENTDTLLDFINQSQSFASNFLA